MSTLKPRVVIVERETELEALLARHATRGQVAFFLERHHQSLAEIDARHRLQKDVVDAVRSAVPDAWSIARVARADLDRFLFFPNDIVVPVGQDGLVANVAKYLDGQPVIGIAPDPASGEGILTRHAPAAAASLFRRTGAGDIDIEPRAMVEAETDTGETLTALNEIFLGHRSHQSARYEIEAGGQAEFQSSSGVIVATGTGLTGWARSIMEATGQDFAFAPTDPTAAFFAREPWPSRLSGTSLRAGRIGPDTPLRLVSRMNEGGVIFADGIEQDFLHFDWGTGTRIRLADRALALVA